MSVAGQRTKLKTQNMKIGTKVWTATEAGLNLGESTHLASTAINMRMKFLNVIYYRIKRREKINLIKIKREAMPKQLSLSSSKIMMRMLSLPLLPFSCIIHMSPFGEWFPTLDEQRSVKMVSYNFLIIF
jgi:hypothetical protein